MFLKELFAYIISGEFSMKFLMEKEQTITRFSDCARLSKSLSISINNFIIWKKRVQRLGSWLVVYSV
jgi:hypothetical protein